MRALALLLLASACAPGAVNPSADAAPGPIPDPDAAPLGGADAAPPAPLATRTFTESAEDFLNPERGFYDGVDLVGGGDFSDVRAAGRTLAYAGVHLDGFRDAPLSAAFLSDLEAGFADARAAGIKVVLRFVYNDGPYPDPEPDAPLARVLEHLQQLQPVLAANVDVIAVLQAGLIGAWGEWHSSTNGLTEPDARRDVLLGVLGALPASRATQVRSPTYKSDVFGDPIAEANAYDGSDASRTGHHNDCFLASATDYGTYPDPVEDWKDYVAQDGRFAPVGGETCGLNAPRTDCAEATAELARLHWSFLNALYHPGVLDAWEAQGCAGEVSRRLGYRLALREARHSESVRPGGELVLELRLENVGWAALYNERPVFVVLDDGVAPVALPLAAADPRRWEPGVEVTIAAQVAVPADLAPGSYRLALWLPDAAPGLRERPEYSVQLANDGVWDPVAGWNVLVESLSVVP